ncbi:MAG: glycosyltransferase family 4 protein [Saprospiraceae bacterium]|nr:glycosyltransferase family 4 protein [Saprospiraceae bacterium]
MKILFVCKKFPYPPKDGESIAILQMSQALASKGCEVSLLAMNTTRHPFRHTESVPTELKHFKTIDDVMVDNKIYLWGAFKNLFSRNSYHISRFVSEEFEKKLKFLLQNNEYDIVQLETLYLAPYIDAIKSVTNAPIVMRAHNIEHEIWERISENIRFFPKKVYLQYLSDKLKKFEIEKLNQYDLLVAITNRDLEIFKAMGYKNGCLSSPVGYKVGQHNIEAKVFENPYRMSFIGSLDWLPNLQGLEWFLEEVWPKILKKFPHAEFHFAGRNAPQRLINNTPPRVYYHGEVESSSEFIKQFPLFVVPLRAGSGLRIKILEAMSMGRIVISSSIGLEGILAQHQKQVFIADQPEQYLKALEYIHENKGRLPEISASASQFIQMNFDQDLLADQLMKAYQKALTEAPHA